MTRENAQVPPPPGDHCLALRGGWKAVVSLTWIGVVIGLASVWAVSRQTGLSTWWLGPPGNGRHLLFTILPFIAPFIALTTSIGGSRRTWQVGVTAGAFVVAVGLFDLSRVTRLGVVEIALGCAGAGSSLASWVGTPLTKRPEQERR